MVGPTNSTLLFAWLLFLTHVLRFCVCASVFHQYVPETKDHLINRDLPRVMVVCGLHAREVDTLKLCSDWSLRALNGSPGPQFLFVSVVHADAGESGTCMRTNWRGVDLNRNFPAPPWCATMRAILWDPSGETYSGAEPLSEAETQTIAVLLDEFAPDVLISAHSGARAILWPYDSGHTPPASMPGTRFLSWEMGYGSFRPACIDCIIGPAPDVLGYFSCGTLVDYAVYEKHVLFALTLELDGGRGDQLPVDCREFFSVSDAVIEDWGSAFNLLSQLTRAQLDQLAQGSFPFRIPNPFNSL